ncbi:hypothetical protein CRENBAI_011604 [Crenichthys baileyi]|uniref:Uncharacterized protein n=1 Tax=Crenichthys baileyi TaxID=28760 RepID=A0AAV9RU30_9TELE
MEVAPPSKALQQRCRPGVAAQQPAAAPWSPGVGAAAAAASSSLESWRLDCSAAAAAPGVLASGEEYMRLVSQRSCNLSSKKNGKDGEGEKQPSLGDGAVAGEDAGLPCSPHVSGRETTSLPAEQEARGKAENGDKGDLSPDMESPTWIHQKLTAVLTALQNAQRLLRLPRQESKEVHPPRPDQDQQVRGSLGRSPAYWAGVPVSAENILLRSVLRRNPETQTSRASMTVVDLRQ